MIHPKPRIDEIEQYVAEYVMGSPRRLPPPFGQLPFEPVHFITSEIGYARHGLNHKDKNRLDRSLLRVQALLSVPEYRVAYQQYRWIQVEKYALTNKEPNINNVSGEEFLRRHGIEI